MEILFLYNRLYQTAQNQLKSLQKLDFGTLEKLTKEREDITRDLCESIKKCDSDKDQPKLSPTVKKKIHHLTTLILDIDADIKEILLEELKERTLELSGFHPKKD